MVIFFCFVSACVDEWLLVYVTISLDVANIKFFILIRCLCYILFEMNKFKNGYDLCMHQMIRMQQQQRCNHKHFYGELECYFFFIRKLKQQRHVQHIPNLWMENTIRFMFCSVRQTLYTIHFLLILPAWFDYLSSALQNVPLFHTKKKHLKILIIDIWTYIVPKCIYIFTTYYLRVYCFLTFKNQAYIFECSICF